MLMAARASALVGFLCGLIGFCGYLLGEDWMFSWGRSVSMAPPTSIALMANSAAIHVVCASMEKIAEALNGALKQ